MDGYFGVWNAADGTLIAGSLAAYDPSKKASDIAFTPDSKTLSCRIQSVGIPPARRDLHWASDDLDQRLARGEATRTLPEDVLELDLLGLSADDSSMIAVAGFVPHPEGLRDKIPGRSTGWIRLARRHPTVRPRIHAASIRGAALQRRRNAGRDGGHRWLHPCLGGYERA